VPESEWPRLEKFVRNYYATTLKKFLDTETCCEKMAKRWFREQKDAREAGEREAREAERSYASSSVTAAVTGEEAAQ
jgi:hypothetical protein